jgi:DNA-binding IclR family transcriptional regulator
MFALTPGTSIAREQRVPDWRFLTNHGLVLTYIGRHPDSTGREIAAAVGITERAVRAIVDDLRRAGYVEQEKVGRRNRYRINPARPVRYLGERAVSVGELLDLLWRGEEPAACATS